MNGWLKGVLGGLVGLGLAAAGAGVVRSHTNATEIDNLKDSLEEITLRLDESSRDLGHRIDANSRDVSRDLNNLSASVHELIGEIRAMKGQD
ncbi:MAG: hypothetical protein AAF515_05015 [Pseudomonadota bacterium]